ncbi:hypothetical protein EVAR_39496_1 [Eumeta japonica]|uniref:Uncharacterized protein n=1 Tax=Eumeta variegata TaxID=151549 RepID=A0A4C1VYY8_EUMVA|nr:hypothetical protein EVAR_39496_1 [Eumeta japonica]
MGTTLLIPKPLESSLALKGSLFRLKIKFYRVGICGGAAARISHLVRSQSISRPSLWPALLIKVNTRQVKGHVYFMPPYPPGLTPCADHSRLLPSPSTSTPLHVSPPFPYLCFWT